MSRRIMELEAALHGRENELTAAAAAAAKARTEREREMEMERVRKLKVEAEQAQSAEVNLRLSGEMKGDCFKQFARSLSPENVRKERDAW
jgi:hypothetical protein